MAARVYIQQAAQMQRKLRNPQHPFFVSTIPFAITPFFIAPVMPGETMKNLMVQARVISRPLKSSMGGWWTEFYFFYVKLRDLDEREEFTKMLLDPNWSSAPVDYDVLTSTIDMVHYGCAGANMIDYAGKCLKTVVDEYFRDEGEVAETHKLVMGAGDLREFYAAQINGNSVVNSCYTATEVTTEDVAITVGADDQIRASEIELAMRQWEMLKQANLTTLSYTDFLAQYGIQTKPEEVHRPELIRYVRDWTYPTNTIDPTNGKPTSAAVWSVMERADKDRFFKEPGFLFGVHCSRPKVYLSNVTGTFTNALNNMYAWLPPGAAVMENVSIKKLPYLQGPLNGATDPNGYFFDVKDLFLYGEQWISCKGDDLEVTSKMNRLPLPNATLATKRYPIVPADVAAFFVDTTKPYIEVDGTVSLQIASTIRETTPVGGPATDI